MAPPLLVHLCAMENLAIPSRLSSRVELQLHDGATKKQYRELGLFVRDCISRIERIVERADLWTVKIVPSHVCFCADVIVQDGGIVVQANGNGFDGAVAAWDAFAKVENLLQQNRAHRDTEPVFVDQDAARVH